MSKEGNYRTMTFVVTINYGRFFEPQVVRNYVNMAIKKYQKLCILSGQADYFGGSGVPYFKITEVDTDVASLREVISQIGTLKDHLDEFHVIER